MVRLKGSQPMIILGLPRMMKIMGMGEIRLEEEGLAITPFYDFTYFLLVLIFIKRKMFILIKLFLHNIEFEFKCHTIRRSNPLGINTRLNNHKRQTNNYPD